MFWSYKTWKYEDSFVVLCSAAHPVEQTAILELPFIYKWRIREGFSETFLDVMSYNAENKDEHVHFCVS